MSPQFDDVLLTAYLDDEVTEEERARVVEELRTSEASRKLLKELKSVRDLVVQLHLSPPTRRFEQGPWNATDSPESNAALKPVDDPRVVLNEARWHRKIPFQRLASLAALIAIAICASVLVMRPNTRSLSQSGGTTTDKSVDGHKSVDAKSIEKSGSDVQLNVLVDEDQIGQQPKERGEPTNMLQGREEAKKDFAAVLFDEYRMQPQEDKTRGGLGRKPQSQVPKPAVEYDSKSRQSGIPTDQSAAAPSPAISKPKPSGQKLELGNELAAAADNRADFSLQIVEDIDKLNRSKLQENNEFSKKLLYRYEINKIEQREPQKLSEKNVAPEKDLQLLKSNSMELPKKQSIDDNGIDMKSILVEFQISVEDWELGAKHLRELGMDVPESLPTAEFLEFTAAPRALNESSTVSPIDQFMVDLKAVNVAVASNWRFSAASQHAKTMNLENETQSNEPAGKKASAGKGELGKQKRSSSPPIQIRVRPIK